MLRPKFIGTFLFFVSAGLIQGCASVSGWGDQAGWSSGDGAVVVEAGVGGSSSLRQLEGAATGDLLIIDDRRWQVLNGYSSAAGSTCKTLCLLDSRVMDRLRVACRGPQGWDFVKDVVSEQGSLLAAQCSALTSK